VSTHQERQTALRKWLDAAGADAILVSLPANVRYLSGFVGEGHLVLTAEAGAICTDTRYQIEAEQAGPDLEVAISPNGHVESATEFLRAHGAGILGFEERGITYFQYKKLADDFGADKLKPTSGLVEAQRLVKDEDEIAAIGAAAALVDEALTGLLAELEAGPTEREVAFELDRRILVGGADEIAFDTIVASGPSAASPHARPTSRRVQAGDMVKIDVGCRLNGYCSDITRTSFCGEPSERFRQVYEAVADAQQVALDSVATGVACADLDKAARDVISEAGFGEYFTHGLGHGVGLEVHEAPRVSARSEDVLEAGMVITVEPGIYMRGWGGVRIEDLVAVTADGCEVLTGTPKLKL